MIKFLVLKTITTRIVYNKGLKPLTEAIPSPMPEFVVSGMRHDFPKLPYSLGFGKYASLHSRNNHQIGDGIGKAMYIIRDWIVVQV